MVSRMADEDDFQFGSTHGTGSSEVAASEADLESELNYNRQRSEGLAASADSGRLCVVCDEERCSKKSKYCNTHRRAFDCIQRQCLKGHTKEHPTKEGNEFLQVFGDSKAAGDDTTAARVLMDFVRMFPEGQSKSTKKRGPIDISQYVHTQGVKKFCGDRARRPKLDYEAFICRTRTCRNWSAQKSDIEWNKMKSNDQIERDNLGPPDAPLRLFIPSWMVAEDGVDDGVQRFEQKSLHSMSKAAKMTEEDKQAILGEVALGFSRLHAPDSGASSVGHASVEAPLHTGAITGAAAVGSVATLVSAAAAGMRESGGGTVRPDSSPAKPGQLGPGQPAAQTRNRSGADIARLRNTTNLTVTREFNDMKRKLEVAILDATGIMSRDRASSEELFFKTVDERVKLAKGFLGVQLTTDQGAPSGQHAAATKCELVPMEIVSPLCPGEGTPAVATGADKVKAHSLLVQDILSSIPLKPIECPDQLESATCIAEYISMIPTMCLEADVEQVAKRWEKTKVLVQQLLNALKAASRDLRAAIDRRAKQEAREVQKAAAELGAKAKKEAEKLAQAAKNMLSGGKDSRIFCIKWEESGHLAIPSFNDEAEMQESFSKHGVGVLSKPFIVLESGGLNNALAAGKKFAETCDKWQKKFPTAPQSKGPEKRTAAPLTSALGSEELDGVWEKFVPKEFQIIHGQPSLKALMEKPWLVGYMPGLVLTAFEADFMGTIRLQMSGSMRVLAFAADGAARVAKSREVAGLLDVVALFQETTVASLPEKGLSVMYGMVSPGNVLVVPPGFIVCATTADSQAASFVRQSFLCKGGACVENLTAIAGRVGGALVGETLNLKSTLEIVEKESAAVGSLQPVAAV